MGIHMLDLLIYLCGQINIVNTQRFSLATDLPIDDTTLMTLRFENGMSPCFATLGATARSLPLQILRTKGWLVLRDESPLIFHPMDSSLETIAYPLFGKERPELEVFADAVAGKSTYPFSDAEAIHGIEIFEAIEVSTGGADTVTTG
jgi:predicted dehydrogenase